MAAGTASLGGYGTYALSAAGVWTYTLDDADPAVQALNGAATLTDTFSALTADGTSQLVSVTIHAQDDAPVARADAVTTNEASAVSGSVFLDNGSGADHDDDDPTLTVSAVNGSAANVGNQFMLTSGALLRLNADGTYTYNPNGAFNPTPAAGSGASNQPEHDNFTYTLANGNTVMVSVTIAGIDSDDTLFGTSGNDTLNGGIGVDSMSAGTGDDVYYVDNPGDVVIEQTNQGRDVIYATVSYTLAAGTSVEALSTDSIAGTDAINFTGNSFNNEIYGNNGANILNGGGGGDYLVGWGGDDTYLIFSGAEIIIENLNGGRDVVYTSVSYALAAGISVEALSTDSIAGTDAINLTGNAFNNEIYGNNGANLLNGGGGGDYLVGWGGDDTYLIFSGAEIIIENLNGGRDVVYTSVSYALAAGAYVEALSTDSIAGTSAINLTGNAFNNEIYGNNGANILNGGGGGDYLVGWGGDDTYLIFSGAEIIIENQNGGRDVVYTSVSYALAAGSYVEALSTDSIAGTNAINLFGNAFNNEIYGNNGANILNGGGGGDYLVGWGGDDTYLIFNGTEIIIENQNGGRDVVYTSLSYALDAGVSVEALSTDSIAGTNAINLTGNEFGNEVYGNNGANVLNGGGAADYLVGYGGADSFAFTTALGGGNIDILADFSVADDTILLENAVFTGLANGALAAGAFVTGAAAGDADDRIVYNSATGQIFFDADGNGAGAAVQFATVNAGTILTAADFMVI